MQKERILVTLKDLSDSVLKVWAKSYARPVSEMTVRWVRLYSVLFHSA